MLQQFQTFNTSQTEIRAIKGMVYCIKKMDKVTVKDNVRDRRDNLCWHAAAEKATVAGRE